MHFRDSPDSLNGLGIPGNNWFRRFAVTCTYSNQSVAPDTPERCICCHLFGVGSKPYCGKRFVSYCKQLQIYCSSLMKTSSQCERQQKFIVNNYIVRPQQRSPPEKAVLAKFHAMAKLPYLHFVVFDITRETPPFGGMSLAL